MGSYSWQVETDFELVGSTGQRRRVWHAKVSIEHVTGALTVEGEGEGTSERVAIERAVAVAVRREVTP